MAPKGDSNNDKPRLPSVKPSRCLMPGMAATQVPNKRLDVANKKLIASAGLFFTKDERFFIIWMDRIINYAVTAMVVKLMNACLCGTKIY